MLLETPCRAIVRAREAVPAERDEFEGGGAAAAATFMNGLHEFPGLLCRAEA